MKISCPQCTVIAAIGRTKWFLDGGPCRYSATTIAGGAAEHEQCQILAKTAAEAMKGEASFEPLSTSRRRP